MKLTIECTEEQAQLMLNCLEESFRFRMKQPELFLDNIILELFPVRTGDEEKDKKAIRRWSEKRVFAENACEKLMKCIYDSDADLVDEAHEISDMWSVIRHEIYMLDHDGTDYMDVRGDTPIQLGDLPLIKCEVEK